MVVSRQFLVWDVVEGEPTTLDLSPITTAAVRVNVYGRVGDPL